MHSSIPAGQSRRGSDSATNPTPNNPFSNIGADFKRDKRKELQADVEKLEEKKRDSDIVAKRLRNFEVLRSRLYIEKGGFAGDTPVIELTVKNGTGNAVRRAYFRGTLQTPGRSIPWMRETFDYTIPGGLEPGEQAEWKLMQVFGSKWTRAQEKPGMKLDVEVIRLDGHDGKPFLHAGFDDDDQEKLDSLIEELSKLN